MGAIRTRLVYLDILGSVIFRFYFLWVSLQVISTVEDENINNNEKVKEKEEESSERTKADESNCENTNQVNGTLHEAENEIPVVQMCIRNGCINSAVNNPEWEQEFCSNDCVVMHCR